MVRRFRRDESGQAAIEYILLLAVVVTFYSIVVGALRDRGIGDSLLLPVRESFAYAYKYGHPDARGYDEGDPKMHPRIVGGDNFRIFINPGTER